VSFRPIPLYFDHNTYDFMQHTALDKIILTHFISGEYIYFIDPMVLSKLKGRYVDMPAKKKTEVVSPTIQDTPKAKRVFRTTEERIAEIDKKIMFHQKALEQLDDVGSGGRFTDPGAARRRAGDLGGVE
jgi:hypothetical protein